MLWNVSTTLQVSALIGSLGLLHINRWKRWLGLTLTIRIVNTRDLLHHISEVSLPRHRPVRWHRYWRKTYTGRGTSHISLSTSLNDFLMLWRMMFRSSVGFFENRSFMGGWKRICNIQLIWLIVWVIVIFIIFSIFLACFWSYNVIIWFRHRL